VVQSFVMDEHIGARPQIGSVRLPRLSAPRKPGSDPTFKELGLGPLADESKNWHHERAGSLFWELNVTAGSHLDAWREIPVLMGSCAESALLAGSAEVEIECLRRAMADGLHKEYGLAQRFFAEAQGQQILGCGHRLANIAVRTLMRAPRYPWDEKVGCSAPIPAFSDRKEDWVSMSDMASYRRAARRSPYRSLHRLTTVVVDIPGSLQWKMLEDRRARDFHRGRDESPFVTGASRDSAWRTEGPTRILEPRDDQPTPEDVDRWLKDLGKESHEALLKLARWLRSFRGALYAAVSEITDGSFQIG
jgi:hypothetical protein